jgi:hypothetical protein
MLEHEINPITPNAMKALRIYAGPIARAHIARQGLTPSDVDVVAAAAGGPKGLILGPLDRHIFGDWLNRGSHTVDLIGASIGGWRMAAACLPDPVAAFERLAHDYIHQNYEVLPGQKRVTAEQVSAQFSRSLQAFFGGSEAQLLQHPRYCT